jgi:hypothetical protein
MSQRARWFVTKDGHTRLGPYTAEQLRELACDGRLGPEDMVLLEGRTKWTAARDIQSLFGKRRARLPTPRPRSPFGLIVSAVVLVAVAFTLGYLAHSLWGTRPLELVPDRGFPGPHELPVIAHVHIAVPPIVPDPGKPVPEAIPVPLVVPIPALAQPERLAPPPRPPLVVEPLTERPLPDSPVVRYCYANLSKQVGDGECTALASAAIRSAGLKSAAHFRDFPGPGDHVWGDPVYFLEVQEGTRKEHGTPGMIQPGDVIQFRAARFEGNTPAGTYSTTCDHHTSVVRELDEVTAVIVVFEQNVGTTKYVRDGRYVLGDLRTGWLRAYHPLPTLPTRTLP